MRWFHIMAVSVGLFSQLVRGALLASTPRDEKLDTRGGKGKILALWAEAEATIQEVEADLHPRKPKDPRRQRTRPS